MDNSPPVPVHDDGSEKGDSSKVTMAGKRKRVEDYESRGGTPTKNTKLNVIAPRRATPTDRQDQPKVQFPPPLVNENGQIDYFHRLLLRHPQQQEHHRQQQHGQETSAQTVPSDEELYELVSAYLDQYPQVVAWADVYGRTPLFYACKSNGVPLKVIRLLLVAYPQAMCQPDFCGQTCLAIMYHSSKACSLLDMALHEEPSLAMTTTINFCMDHNHHGARYRTTRETTTAAALGSQYDALSKVPLLFQLCEAAPLKRLFASSHGRAATAATSSESSPSQSPQGTNDREATQLWTKLMTTLRAAFRHEFGHCQPELVDRQNSAAQASSLLCMTEPTVPELHMALRLKIPALALFHLCRMHPEQISMPMSVCMRKDESSSSSDLATITILPLHFVLADSNFAKSPRVTNLIQIMTHYCPQALMKKVDVTVANQQDGSTNKNAPEVIPSASVWPLHRSLKSGYTWYTGISHMVAMVPEILHHDQGGAMTMMDSEQAIECSEQPTPQVSLRGWQAFQEAAIQRRVAPLVDGLVVRRHRLQWNAPDLDTIYHLLRERPCVT